MELKFANYGQHRDVGATEEEIKIFEALCKETGCSDLELVRKSDSYVTAALGEWDLARFKFTQRAKWIQFPVFDRGSAKHRIESTDDVSTFADLITRSVEHIRKYS